MLGADEKPDVTYADVGGLDMQKQEIREAVELPLTHFDLVRVICSLFITLRTFSQLELSIFVSQQKANSFLVPSNWY
jgi:hypothetical protein